MRNVLLKIAIVVTLTACGSEATALLPPLYQAPNPTTVLMGDSITYRWAFATPSILQLLPTANDEGISGNDTAAMSARFYTDVIEQHPKTVVIEGGTNDLLEDSEDIQYLADMGAAATAAGIHIVLCTIPPSPILDAGSVTTWNTEVRALASDNGYTVADYASAPWTDADFGADQEHPNDAGYELMWPVLQTALQGLSQ